MTFKVGDTVVYPSQGGGRIDEIATREVLGETRSYLKLSFIRGDMDVLIPLEKTEEVRLRHTIVKEDIDKLFNAILSPKIELPTHWPPRHRFELEVLARAETLELGELLGILAQRDAEKGLADTEREIMERSKDMLASELAVVLNVPLKEATEEINKKLTAIQP